MNALRAFFRRLLYPFQRRQREAEMQEEMRFHLEQRAAELASDGLAAAEARDAAQRRFGNLASLQEQARAGYGWGAGERLAKDIGFAVRQLLRAPGFSLLAIVTLACGIGANTSMFSVINGIVFKPLPYAQAGQLDRFYRTTPQNHDGNFSTADFFDLQPASADYGDVAAYLPGDASLSDPGVPAEMVSTVRATTNLFTLLGVQPQLGRAFRAEEAQPGHDRVVLLSPRVWRNRYASDPAVIGRLVRVDGEPHEVIGVLPESFNEWRHLGWVDFFRPLVRDTQTTTERQGTSLRVIGRRAAGHTLAEADDWVARFGSRQAAAFPAVNAASSWRRDFLQESTIGGSARPTLIMLIGLSGFVLLIACSNLANLLLARTMARAREFAVRAALGASRLQLLRPLVIEALVLSLAGGAGAILVAQWFAAWAAVRSTGDNGEQVVFTLDWSVMGWAFAASLFTALAFGLAPALFALRLDLNNTLKSGGRGLTGGRGHQRFRQLLIVGQFAFAMVLLTGAGLFVRGLDDLNHRQAGWKSEHVVTGTILLPTARYADAGKLAAFHRLALERLAALPGVTEASVSAFMPLFNWPDVRKFLVEGRPLPERGREPAAMVNRVSPHYFGAVRTPLLAGRVFAEQDSATATRVCVISQGTAKGLFGAGNPIGRRLGQMEGDKISWTEVVGVVNDVESIESERGAVNYQVYLPMAQEPGRQGELAVRAAGVDASTLVEQVRSAFADLDPDLPVRQLQSADATIARANYQLGFLRDMLIAFALLGLGLASLGVYGVIARTMAQRTPEFAVRLALGARVGDLSRLVLASGVKLALIGSALGLIGAFAVAQLLMASYPGMRFGSGLVLAGVTALLVVVALVACWLPARQAARVDPMTVLRAE